MRMGQDIWRDRTVTFNEQEIIAALVDLSSRAPLSVLLSVPSVLPEDAEVPSTSPWRSRLEVTFPDETVDHTLVTHRTSTTGWQNDESFALRFSVEIVAKHLTVMHDLSKNGEIDFCETRLNYPRSGDIGMLIIYRRQLIKEAPCPADEDDVLTAPNEQCEECPYRQLMHPKFHDTELAVEFEGLPVELRDGAEPTK